MSSPSVGDSQIINESVDNPDAFGEIFDRHYTFVWQFIARRAGKESADALAGEVFVRAFERRATYRPDHETSRWWLCGIARNLILKEFRSAQRQRRAYLRWTGLHVRSDIATLHDPAIEHVPEALLAADIAPGVLERLTALDPVDREILCLATVEAMSSNEIALIVAMRPGTVRSRLSRARSSLRSTQSLVHHQTVQHQGVIGDEPSGGAQRPLATRSAPDRHLDTESTSGAIK